MTQPGTFLSALFTLALINHMASGALVITTDFEREFVGSEGIKRFFYCEFDPSDARTLKALKWTWNDQPLLTYDFQTFQNKFYDTPTGITINTNLSGRERLGLADMTPASDGLLKCSLEDIYGKSVSKQTIIRILPKTRRHDSIRAGGLETEDDSKSGQASPMSLPLVGSLIFLLISYLISANLLIVP